MSRESGKDTGKGNFPFGEEFYSLSPSERKAILEKLAGEDVDNLLGWGLCSTREQAIAALEHLEKDNALLTSGLRDKLVDLLYNQEQGLSMRAALLLAENAPGYVEENPHLNYRLAGLAHWSPDKGQRYSLIKALAALPERNQQFHLPFCPDRDEVVEYLKGEGENGVLLSLLRAAFYRWQPEMDDITDLEWMLCVLRECSGTTGDKAKMVLSSGEGKQLFQSRALLDVLREEAYEAAADCIVRCLRGPGGEHRLEEMQEHLSETRLGSKVLAILCRSPGSFAMMLEDGMPGWCSKAVSREELTSKIRRGIRAANQAIYVLNQHSSPGQ